MAPDETCDRTAEAPNERNWERIYAELASADRVTPLEPAALEQLAIAAYLTGRENESTDVLARVHAAFLALGDAARAVRAGFWLAFVLINKGERARAAGWLSRLRRLLDEADLDCVERGYLLLPAALQHSAAGDLPAAAATFEEAARIGERFGDPDLVNLARQGRGRALIGLGDIEGGVALLDEAMVAVTAGEVGPVLVGTIYCSVISACFDLFDIRRAQEWTEALRRWCESQRGLVPYRGECLVHRAEIMALHGVWPDALREAQRACECLAQLAPGPASGAAFYQLGEVHRLRGDFTKAEDAYRLAAESGRSPHPGLALLWLAQRRLDAAAAAISRVNEEARDRRLRSRVLPALVEILVAAREVPRARAAAEELSAIARAIGSPFLRALSFHSTAAVLLAEGDARTALTSARDACAMWRELEAPYEAARTTVLIGLACRELGDVDSALMEFDAARRTFSQLGAAPDLARLDDLSARSSPPARDTSGELTAREIQVLKLMASGKTNHAIAETLRISEKTVARHVSNIFVKLDLSNRSAATAYAFRHGLI